MQFVEFVDRRFFRPRFERKRKASGFYPEAFRIRRRSPTLPFNQYHRPSWLNCCVRDGNRCFPRRMDTAKASPGVSARRRRRSQLTSRLSRPVPHGRCTHSAFRARILGDFKPINGYFCIGIEREGSPEGLQRPVRVCPGRQTTNAVKQSPVSTGRLRVFRPLHRRPINHLVWMGALVPEGTWNPDLGVGFPLRCLQRLSVPNVATQRCP